MIVEFRNGVGCYSGKYDDVVYQRWFNGRLCMSRKYTYPRLSTHCLDIAEISKNLDNVYKAADPLWVADFKAYSAQNSQENIPRNNRKLRKMPSSKSLFIKCMWSWRDSDPTHVDLKTVSINDIVGMESPVITVKACVDAGYIRRVKNYGQYIHPIGQ